MADFSRPPGVFEDRMWEWLTMRLDRQDQLLQDVLREARKTNGNIRDHDGRLKELEQAAKEEQEDQHAAAELEIRNDESRRRRREWVIGSVCVLLGGSLVQPFAHLTHLLFT